MYWLSRKIGRKLGSTTSAELLAMRDAVKMSWSFIHFVQKLWGEMPLVVVVTDSQLLMHQISSKQCKSEPRMQGELEYVLENLMELGAKKNRDSSPGHEREITGSLSAPPSIKKGVANRIVQNILGPQIRRDAEERQKKFEREEMKAQIRRDLKLPPKQSSSPSLQRHLQGTPLHSLLATAAKNPQTESHQVIQFLATRTQPPGTLPQGEHRQMPPAREDPPSPSLRLVLPLCGESPSPPPISYDT
uniref:Uncharacterized protein n=1 Tax=Chromera velia CCMP2878 TaxID=1169474 RepID=A0A0G4IEN3_9ALVE|eukprot:Cvel_13683.t1-p1 / transcript=Cvel_13683.t1 / gene=Cvel_13683 / organism=Chromera_velia_CCMP2878 / gene_product=hypothetical protein / transcript_product=hypothetical protein / location=Cvel_scaffold945:23337-25947(+) / protein_length=245 / sequence_SO=supercontig / SO=protein_coding / is_pseudo=false